MEKIFNRKSETVESIRDKYNQQIDELSSDDSPVVQMVIENMKLSMEEEIMETVLKLEEQKKKEVESLKKKYKS